MINDDLSERQIEAVEKLTKSRGGICWWKIGEGKTRLALAWARRMIDRSLANGSDFADEVLIICSPNAIRQWKDEAAKFKWTPRLRFLSYGSLHKIQTSELADVKCVIIDELWLFKNIRTKRTLAVGQITHHYPTLGLSGSMVTARNIEDVYGQSYSVGISHLLARSLTNFRTQFCVSDSSGYGLEFYAKRGAMEIIQERLAHHVDIYFPKDVRQSRIIPIRVAPSKEQQRIIRKLSNDYFIVLKTGELNVQNEIALISKIQQVSDGAFLDNTGNVSHVESNKFERLLELCKEFADAGERAIIWFAFKASLDKALEVLGKQATALSSDHQFDSEGWKRGIYNFCLATVGSGSSLDDFANTERAVFYSLPFSPVAFQQAKGRTNRRSTLGSIVYYHVLTTTGTLDEQVYQTVDFAGRIEKTLIRTSAEIIREYMLKLNEERKQEIHG